jgi:phospholipase C
LTNNPNKFQPHRIDRSNPVICNPLHDYTDEQKSYNGGQMDLFVQNDGKPDDCQKTPTDNQVMDYYDGNTVTALWNYAQHFAMSDNFHGSTFGPSTPGHINLVSGNTHGAFCVDVKGNKLDDCTEDTYSGVVGNTLIGDIDPTYDTCSEAPSAGNSTTPSVYQIEMTGKNIGDLLTAKGISWGWFSGGFKLPEGDCNKRSSHVDSSGGRPFNYYADVEPFQYYKSTANPKHLPPTPGTKIGDTDKQANHQYDLSDFWAAVKADNMPGVSFIKAPDYQQGHPKYSDPLAEQTFLVNTINKIQGLPQWRNTAIILTWDDSGGLYDQVMPPIVSKSDDPKNDALYGPATLCNPPPAAKITQNDKCGYGPRIPVLIISPYAKMNFVDHTSTDFTSVIKFIQDNWGLKQIGGGSLDVLANPLNNMFDFRAPHTTPLILNPSTGEKSHG